MPLCHNAKHGRLPPQGDNESAAMPLKCNRITLQAQHQQLLQE